MNAAVLSGRIVRRLFQHANVSRIALQQCCISSSAVVSDMHTSLHKFTDDESIMKDTGLCQCVPLSNCRS